MVTKVRLCVPTVPVTSQQPSRGNTSCDVLTALRRVHTEVGYAHADIKPRNVLLWNGGSRGAVTDFCGSHELVAGVAPMTTWTWPCLAPEVAMGGMTTVTPASDLYAVGMTLFETLCGPFPAALLGAAAKARVRRGLRAIPDAHLVFEPHVPPDLRRLVGRALSRDPTARAHHHAAA
jgi:eukaryotic-like serine/threonine-protein kinase